MPPARFGPKQKKRTITLQGVGEWGKSPKDIPLQWGTCPLRRQKLQASGQLSTSPR